MRSADCREVGCQKGEKDGLSKMTWKWEVNHCSFRVSLSLIND